MQTQCHNLWVPSIPVNKVGRLFPGPIPRPADYRGGRAGAGRRDRLQRRNGGPMSSAARRNQDTRHSASSVRRPGRHDGSRDSSALGSCPSRSQKQAESRGRSAAKPRARRRSGRSDAAELAFAGRRPSIHPRPGHGSSPRADHPTVSRCPERAQVSEAIPSPIGRDAKANS